MCMDVEFKNSDLEQMAYDKNYSGNWSAAIVKAFRKRLSQIQQAPDRQSLYKWKSLRLEKLKAGRKDECSMRLNDQYRLIVKFKAVGGKQRVTLINIEDYH